MSLRLLKLFQLSIQVDMSLFLDDISLLSRTYSTGTVKVLTASGTVMSKNATAHHFVI